MASFYVFNHVPRELLAPLLADIHTWLMPGGWLLTAFGQSDLEGWTGEWLGAPTFFSSFPPEINTRLVREAGFAIEEDEVVAWEGADTPGVLPVGARARVTTTDPIPVARRQQRSRRGKAQFEEENARDRMVDLRLARLEAEGGVDPAGGFHPRQRVEADRCVAELAGSIDRRCGEPLAEARTARGRPDVEPFQLRGTVGEMLDRGGADQFSTVVSCDEHRSVVAGESGELVLEIPNPELVADPGRVLAEHHAQLGGVAVARVGDQRSVRSSSTSSGSARSPAVTFARTCSGFVAPAMTDATAGCARRPPNARSRSAMPRASANCLQRLRAIPAHVGDLLTGEASLGRLLAATVLAGEQPAREREVRQEADPEPLARRQHLVLRLALDERVVVLDGDEARRAPVARRGLGGLDLLGGEVRGPIKRTLPSSTSSFSAPSVSSIGVVVSGRCCW